jgi:hypothetical protein
VLVESLSALDSRAAQIRVPGEDVVLIFSCRHSCHLISCDSPSVVRPVADLLWVEFGT